MQNIAHVSYKVGWQQPLDTNWKLQRILVLFRESGTVPLKSGRSITLQMSEECDVANDFFSKYLGVIDASIAEDFFWFLNNFCAAVIDELWNGAEEHCQATQTALPPVS